MNPFEGKSLTEWRASVPGLSNAELDALAAEYCDDWAHNEDRSITKWGGHEKGWYCVPLPYTTDWREAGRLLVKYQLGIYAGTFNGQWWAHRVSQNRGSLANDPRRAITEAAVIAELTKRIGGSNDASD